MVFQELVIREAYLTNENKGCLDNFGLEMEANC